MSLALGSMGNASKAWAGWIQCNPAAAKKIPVEEPVLKQGLPEIVEDEFHILVKNGLLKKDGCVVERGERRWKWRATEKARPVIRELREKHSGRLPCGHDGFRNPRGVDGFVCTTCGRELTREDIEGSQ